MKIPFKKIKSASRQIYLDSNRKKMMKNQIVEYVQRNPVRISGNQRLILHNPIFNFLTLSPMKALVLALVVLLSGGTTVFAAENSQPGDVLYPVKVNINEEVVSTLHFYKDKKADWEVTRVERRLQEANELTQAGELTEDLKNTIDNLVVDHTDKIRSLVDDLKSDTDNEDEVVGIDEHLTSVLDEYNDELDNLEVDKADLDLENDQDIEVSDIDETVEDVEGVESTEAPEMAEDVEVSEEVEEIEELEQGDDKNSRDVEDIEDVEDEE